MPATIDDITAEVTAIAAVELGVPAERLLPDTDLRAIEGIDSVKVLRMIAKIERAYDVELADEEVFGLSSVVGTAEAVSRALGDQKPGDQTLAARALGDLT